jgi:hypothetical protein
LGIGYLIPNLGFGLLEGELHTLSYKWFLLQIAVEEVGLGGEISGKGDMVF